MNNRKDSIRSNSIQNDKFDIFEASIEQQIDLFDNNLSYMKKEHIYTDLGMNDPFNEQIDCYNQLNEIFDEIKNRGSIKLFDNYLLRKTPEYIISGIIEVIDKSLLPIDLIDDQISNSFNFDEEPVKKLISETFSS